MLGFRTPITFHPSPPISLPSLFNPNPNPFLPLPLTPTPKSPSPTLKFQPRTNPRKPRKVSIRAENGNGQSTDTKEEEREDEGFKKKEEEEVNRNGRPTLNLRWADLVLDPDPDNIFAVALTGLLAWASAQVLWQLFFISLAIIFAALKYSFIAALLIFILITLL